MTRVIAGRYQLTAPIGRGGAGVVWRARDDLLRREVAVKEIVRIAVLDEDERAESYERTLREARAAARITHPNVAGVYDVVSEDGCSYIVMELVRGRALSQVVEDDGPLAPGDVVDVGRQVLAALMAGHAAGVLHRDLKPANVLLTAGGRAVLTDFGIASVAGDPSITRTGMVVGTPGYLAPERIRGERATPAADLWSLGATLFLAACGSGPFDGPDEAIATMYVIATGEPRELPSGGPLRPIVGALLNRDPRQRPGADEVARALDAAAESLARLDPTWEAEAAPALADGSGRGPSTVRSSWVRPGLPDRGGTDSPRTDQGGARPRIAAPRSPGRARAVRGGAVLVAGLAAVTVAASAVVAVALANGGGRAAQAGSAALMSRPPVSMQFRVAVAANAQGGTDLFARAPDGSLLLDVLGAGSWTALPGGRTYDGVPAVVTGPDGQLAVFARTAGGRIAELRQAGASWAGPVILGTESVSSDPSAISLPGGRLDVFARLPDGGLGYTTRAGTGAWSRWTSLGGSIGSPPAAALDSAGQPQVFALTSDGALVDYPDLRGPVTLPGGHAYTGMPAVGTNLDGRLEVFTRTTADTIEHVWQQPGPPGVWGGPQVLIGDATSNPAVMSVNGGRLEVFAATVSGHIVHTWQQRPAAGTGWNAAESLRGSTAGAPSVIRVGGESELFVRMPGGTIGFDHLDTPTGTWSGWSGLSGSF